MVKRKLLIGVLVVVGIYVFSLIYIVVMALTLKPALAKTSQAVKAVTVNLQEKDLGAAQTNLAQAETELQTISRRYNLIAWLKFIPGLGIYVSDGRHGLNA
ncbi:MAG: hypothetical protein Q8P47_01375, partial [Candidatus Beckwithbacteria bacterium]|nr:hypothetical protein [Candidatus Beckwithbacteria bacterium]